MKVELIYDAGCPDVAATRSALVRALMETGVDARWTEWDRAAPDSPDYVRRYASPTILVDGADAGGADDAVQADACRVYQDSTGRMHGVPPVGAIVTALRAAGTMGRPGRPAWMPTFATLPAVGAILVPKLACPLCIPVIGSALGAAGVELFPLTPWVFGFALGLVALTLVFLGHRARRAGRWGMWLVAASGGVAMLAGKFALDSLWLTGAGVVVFVAAALLGGRAARRTDCAACRESEAARPVDEH
jgi:hypothetical protein